MKHVRLQIMGYIRENTPFTTIEFCVGYFPVECLYD